MAYADKRHYVYVYLDPRKPGEYVYDNYRFEYEPFYVGKGNGGRYKYHLRCLNGDNPHKDNKIRKITGLGLEIPIERVFFSEDSESSYTEEQRLIDLIGRSCDGGILTNCHAGGKGGTSPPQAIRDKISNSLMGRVVPEDQLAKMRAYWASREGIMKGRVGAAHPAYGRVGPLHHMYGKRGVDSPNYGRKCSPEEVERMHYVQIKFFMRVYDYFTDQTHIVYNEKEFSRKNGLPDSSALAKTCDTNRSQMYCYGLRVIEKVPLPSRWYDDPEELAKYYKSCELVIPGLRDRDTKPLQTQNQKISFTKFKYLVKHGDELYEVLAMTDFCKYFNLDKASLHRTYGNAGYTQHKGFTIIEKEPLPKKWHLIQENRDKYFSLLETYKQAA